LHPSTYKKGFTEIFLNILWASKQRWLFSCGFDCNMEAGQYEINIGIYGHSEVGHKSDVSTKPGFSRFCGSVQ
jgi:hypothetical protein